VVTGAQRLLPLAAIDRLAPADDTVVRLAWTTADAVTIADTANAAGLRLRVNELERFYYVALPVTGHVESHHAGTATSPTPTRSG
jgi:hypothetical protein